MAKLSEPAVFTIVFTKGQAARNRLAMSHVITVLRELDFMIRDVGARLQRAKGMENPTGDFGIELLTGETGIAFLKGSVKAKAVPTRDIEIAVEAFEHVINTANRMEKKGPGSVDENDVPIVRRFANITKVQERDYTELHLEVKRPGKQAKKGVFSDAAMQAVKKMATSDFRIEGLTLYGKLKALTDRSRVEEDDDDIWGELVEDNGTVWRIKFKPADLEKAKTLFTRQVVAVGHASYFKSNSPRLDVDDIKLDTPLGYLEAFNSFSSSYEEIFGDQEPQDIMRDIRG